jgi:peptidoglycan/LPS O-acetylase OafA/YrhL
MAMSPSVHQIALASSPAALQANADLAYQRYQQSRFFPALDGLRCISILGVIAFHAGLTNPSFFGRNGGLGVEFFFVISGFLITTLLLREQSDTGHISLKKFYIRRALRIFPMYFTVLALYCLATFVTDRHAPEGQEFFHRLPIFLTFTSNWFMPASGHFALSWSLSTEEQFYLFWPLLVCLSRRRWTPLIVISALALSDQMMEIMIGTGAYNLGQHGNRIVTSLATPICIGCVLAYTLHWRAGFAVAQRALRHPWLAAGAMAVAMAFTCVFPSEQHLLARQATLLVIALLGGVIVAACCVSTGGVLKPILTNRFVRHVGVISYGMYLMHQLCLKVAHKLPVVRDMPILVFIVGLAIVITVASLSYRFYEKRFLQLKDRLAGRPEAANEPFRPIAHPVAA